MKTIIYNPPKIMWAENWQSNGVEKVQILEEGLSTPDCTIPTYLVRYPADGRKARTSKDGFFETREAALEDLIQRVEETIEEIKKTISNSLQGLNDTIDLRDRLKQQLQQEHAQ
jgi:hypothetical protein